MNKKSRDAESSVPAITKPNSTLKGKIFKCPYYKAVKTLTALTGVAALKPQNMW